MQRFCIQKTYISSIHDLINICMHFVQFIHCLYVQKTYKGCFSQLVVQVLYSLYIICMYKKHTKAVSVSYLVVQVLYSLRIVCMYKKYTFQIASRFWSKLCTCFVQFVHFFYICRNVMFIFCTFIIIQNFDLYNLCIQNIYKFSVLYNFCIRFVQFLCILFGNGLLLEILVNICIAIVC